MIFLGIETSCDETAAAVIRVPAPVYPSGLEKKQETHTLMLMQGFGGVDQKNRQACPPTFMVGPRRKGGSDETVVTVCSTAEDSSQEAVDRLGHPHHSNESKDDQHQKTSSLYPKCFYAGAQVLSHVLVTQDHRATGGVVPTQAARQHVALLPTVVQQALAQADVREVDAVAVTAGPGLVAGLLVGVTFAQAYAQALGKPLWPVHHLHAHALVAGLHHQVPFPFLLLLLSGGHCVMAIVDSAHAWRVLGQTCDDAAGECLDKVARALGGPYPGGPWIEMLARHGDPHRVPLPIPMHKQKGMNFSFSGLKTACVQWIQRQGVLTAQDQADCAASLQRVIAGTLCARLGTALDHVRRQSEGEQNEENLLVNLVRCVPSVRHCVVAGGVAANQYFREKLGQTCARAGVTLVCPEPALCTDNGVMIAWAGACLWRAGIAPTMPGHVRVRPYWPVDQG